MKFVEQTAIRRTQFKRCSAGLYGGAALVFDSPDSAFDDSTFDDSSAGIWGGGLAYYASYFMPSIANIINVQFRRNSVAAGNGGGLYITNTASVLTNVTAFDNRAAGGSGGAMCIGGIGAPATVALVGGSITHNEATMGGGIAISDDGSALSVTRTRISHNHAVGGSAAASRSSTTRPQ